MFKARIDHLRRSAWAVCLLLAGAPTAVPPAAAAAAELSALERRWLLAALPVLQFAREQRLPLDIVVQPQAAPGETPLGMAYVDGRCKLVLSMRGNPEAQALLERIPPELLQPVVEAIAAHELGHCWRHVQQHWGTLPATVRDWHVRLRAQPHVPSGPHDTRVWVRLAADKGRFQATDSLFEQVQELWQSGLRVHGLQD